MNGKWVALCAIAILVFGVASWELERSTVSRAPIRENWLQWVGAGLLALGPVTFLVNLWAVSTSLAGREPEMCAALQDLPACDFEPPVPLAIALLPSALCAAVMGVAATSRWLHAAGNADDNARKPIRARMWEDVAEAFGGLTFLALNMTAYSPS